VKRFGATTSKNRRIPSQVRWSCEYFCGIFCTTKSLFKGWRIRTRSGERLSLRPALSCVANRLVSLPRALSPLPMVRLSSCQTTGEGTSAT
ncbi:unnamed protein product, partial [Ixodes pacificus]